jgi:ribosome-binding factor A
MSLRMQKVNQEIKRQIMDIVQKEIDDPALSFLSVTKVETSSDLRESKVYFSLLDENQLKYAEKILNKMASFIRVCLGKRVRLKILPHLTFICDNSIKYSVEIYQRIEEIKKNRSSNDVKEDNRDNI